MSTLVNFFDCNSARLGTGTPSCDIPTGVPTGFFLVPKTWRLDTTTETFDSAYITAQIKAGTMIPFLGAINFTDNSEESVIYTTQLGVKLLARDGKPEFTFDFSKGYCFHSAAFSYNSFGSYDVILTYDNGVVFMAKATATSLKGHTAGLVNTGNFVHRDGAESEKSLVMIQLTNPNEYNSQGALLDPVSNGFDIEAVNGIIDVAVGFTGSGTDYVATITAACNSAIDISAIDAADLRWTGLVAGDSAVTVQTVVYDSVARTFAVTASATLVASVATLGLQLISAGPPLEPVAEIPASSGILYKGSGKIS